jgi:hypothetical protein
LLQVVCGGLVLSSEIERVLFGQFGTHALMRLLLSVNRLVIVVAPWTDLTCIKEAAFENASLLSVSAACRDEPPEEMTFPWDIIDFASTRQADGRWEFVLYCGNSVELRFLADFPQSDLE